MTHLRPVYSSPSPTSLPDEDIGLPPTPPPQGEPQTSPQQSFFSHNQTNTQQSFQVSSKFPNTYSGFLRHSPPLLIPRFTSTLPIPTIISKPISAKPISSTSTTTASTTTSSTTTSTTSSVLAPVSHHVGSTRHLTVAINGNTIFSRQSPNLPSGIDTTRSNQTITRVVEKALEQLLPRSDQVMTSSSQKLLGSSKADEQSWQSDAFETKTPIKKESEQIENPIIRKRRSSSLEADEQSWQPDTSTETEAEQSDYDTDSTYEDTKTSKDFLLKKRKIAAKTTEKNSFLWTVEKKVLLLSILIFQKHIHFCTPEFPTPTRTKRFIPWIQVTELFMQCLKLNMPKQEAEVRNKIRLCYKKLSCNKDFRLVYKKQKDNFPITTLIQEMDVPGANEIRTIYNQLIVHMPGFSSKNCTSIPSEKQ